MIVTITALSIAAVLLFILGWAWGGSAVREDVEGWWNSLERGTDSEGQIIVYTGVYAAGTEHLREDDE